MGCCVFYADKKRSGISALATAQHTFGRRRLMKHIRRSVSLLMILFMLAGLSNVSFGKVESTSTLSPKKVVAILYDDSGSMCDKNNKNWFYADYAFQTFIGMLNPGDDVLLTFMSEPNKVIRSNSEGILKDFSSNRQKTIDAIRNYKGFGDTPFNAIDKVGKALHAVDDEDPATQYWFVIIADGAFERVAGDEDTEITVENQKGNEVDDKLAEYAGEHNGKEYQMRFMAIKDKSKHKTKDGKKKTRVIPKETDYVKVEECDGENIVDVMKGMAGDITGRKRVDEADISVNGKEIKVSSAVPLINIQVLAQKSNAKVASAKASEGSGLKSSSVKMSTPEGDSKRKAGKALHATLSTIVPDGKYISAGDYTITMDKDFSAKDLVVLYEVALETRITIIRDGKVIEDTSTLRENENVTVKADLVILGTDEAIDITALPEGMLENMTLTIAENGNESVNEALEKGKSSIEKEYTIQNGETVITARTDLKGFAPLITKETFTAGAPVVSGVTADENELSLRRGTIHGKKKRGGVDFTVTGDGKPLPKKDVDARIDPKMISVTHDGKKTGVKFNCEIDEDGKLHVYPKTSFLNNAFAYIRVPRGEYQVTVTLDDKTSATGTFTVLDYSILGYIITILVLALAALMTHLLRKPHFPSGTMYRTQYSIDTKGLFRYDGTANDKFGYWTKFFTLSGPRKLTTNGLEIEATRNGKLHITSKWIAAHQSPKTGRDHFSFFQKPDPKASTQVKAAQVKNAYMQLRNAKPEPKSPPDKNKLFDTNSALLAIIQPQVVNTYQFIKSRDINKRNRKGKK